MTKTRLLTANLCTMERGLRNQVLANYVQRCGFALMLINGTLIYFVLQALFPDLALWPTMLINVAISAILGFVSGFALGLQATRVVIGTLSLIFPDFHDWQDQRLRHLARTVLPDYDVVCIQECFVGFPLSLSGNYPQKLCDLAKEKAGLTEVALPPQYPEFPCTCLNSGLLVLSKHRIVESSFQLYAYQVP